MALCPPGKSTPGTIEPGGIGPVHLSLAANSIHPGLVYVVNLVCTHPNGAGNLNFSAVTHVLVSRLLARFWMNSKLSMVLLVVPNGFVYA